MNNRRESYWPTDFGVDSEATPLTVLREQAALLGASTKNLVEGIVQTKPDEDMEFRHSLYLSVPTLGNYRYFLLSVLENPGIYPIKIFDGTTTKWAEAQDFDQFNEKLKEILSSDRVRKRVGSLLSYASSGSRF